MVIYEIQCTHGHRFEGWFKDAKSFDAQLNRGMVQCVVCGSAHVARVPSGCHVGTEKVITSKSVPVSEQSHSAAGQNTTSPATPKDQEVMDPVVFIKTLNKIVTEKFKDVGDKFADKAIKMHRHEIPAESIRGTANKEQIERLEEEGVKFVSIPKLPESLEN